MDKKGYSGWRTGQTVMGQKEGWIGGGGRFIKDREK